MLTSRTFSENEAANVSAVLDYPQTSDHATSFEFRGPLFSGYRRKLFSVSLKLHPVVLPCGRSYHNPQNFGKRPVLTRYCDVPECIARDESLDRRNKRRDAPIPAGNEYTASLRVCKKSPTQGCGGQAVDKMIE